MKKRLQLLLAISIAVLAAGLPTSLQAQDCISGTVYSDDNNNGVRDGLEGPLAGQTVVAVASDGTVSQQNTDIDGFYEFCSLTPGDYYLFVQLPSPLLASNPPTQTVTYTAGQSVAGVDFGIADLQTLGAIGGRAFFDLNGNGIQDNFEPALIGYPVTLTGGGLLSPVVVQTDELGNFRFSGLPAGDYTVSIVADIPNTDWVGAPVLGVGLAAGEIVDNLRFVRRPLPGFGSLVDFVCYDLDANGINDPATEPGIGKVVVDLMNSQGVVVASTTTDGRGLYGFIGITPGGYTVSVQYNAQDFNPTTPTSYSLNVPADGFQQSGPFYFEPLRKIFKCGMAVTTFLGDYPNGGGSIGNNGRVLAGKDIRDRTLAPMGVGSPWSAVVDIDNAAWRDTRMGQVFGIALDDDFNVYLTATKVYGNYSIVPGSGLVYLINAYTGGVTDLVTAINTPTVVGNNQLQNNNRGIGNICYNPDNEVLYVTNLADATINVIAAANNTSFVPGEVIQSYPVTSFTVANLGPDRVWGVGFDRSERKVYFSSPLGSGSVDIIAADVDVNGLVIGPETALFSMPTANVADIAFSFDSQRMLVAERNNNPHGSRVFQYPKTGVSSWGPGQEIFVGNYSVNRNAAGGVDYAFTSFSGNTPPDDGCDTDITATGNALILGGGIKIYGFGIIPATGNAQGSYANLNSIFVDSDAEEGTVPAEWDKGDLGDVEVFDCACPVGCDQLGLAITPVPQDSATVDSCCYSLDFANTGQEAVFGIELVALDGVEFDYTITNGFIGPNFGNSNVTIVPGPPVGSGPMPNQVNSLVTICLKNVLATPQYVVVNYLDQEYMTFCSDTLEFRCPIEQSCLFLVSDTLVCDSLGYQFTAVVENPSGGFPIGLVNFNMTSPASGVTYNPGTSFVLTDTIFPGERDTFTFVIQTTADLFGDSLCFVLSAHDGIEERLCCAEIDTCIAFPLCDPCPFVDASVRPVSDVQAEYCCFELFITDTLTYNPNLFTAVQTTILTPGVNFAGLVTLPAQLAGWSYTPAAPTNDITWTHNSGITPNGVNFNLFDFCVEGTTSTDSIYIEVKWLDAEGMVWCSDTLAVYCPFCLTVINDSLTCQTILNPDGSVSQNYAYTFQVQNFSPFPVNTIGIIEAPSSSTNIMPDVITIPTIPAFPPGGTSIPISIVIDGSVGPIDSFCFDIVLRQVIADSIDITCCYATHCIDLPPCDLLPPFRCPDPALISDIPCPLIFDPVCGCNGQTYSNVCFATNAGITLWEPGICGGLVAPATSIVLSGSVNNEAILLQWTIDDDPGNYSHFVLRTWAAGDVVGETLAVLPALPGQQQYSFVDQANGYGRREYDVLAIKLDGIPAFSNVEQVFLMNDAQQQAVVYTYPVPATNTLNILSNHRGAATLELVGPDGRIILQRQENFQGLPVPVDVSSMRSGVYLVRLRFHDGQMGQQRVVKME